MAAKVKAPKMKAKKPLAVSASMERGRVSLHTVKKALVDTLTQTCSDPGL